MTQRPNAVQVLLPIPNGKAIFDYALTSGADLRIGSFVLVSFRKKEIVGVVWSFVVTEIPISKIKSVLKVFDLPNLTVKHINFIKFISEYTLSTYGAVLKMVMPLQSSFNFFRNSAKESQELPKFIIPDFTNEQQQAVDSLISSVTSSIYSVCLLDGVTGSGKTEVYFAAIYKALSEKGSQILVLLPEIMLTAQLIQRFEARFGFSPARWHSDMTLSQKRRIWLDVITGKERLVIGARSALFLPYNNLSLIVVDEEHDASYKQEEGVVYNARDAAVACGYAYKIPVILSSATPSMETLMNVTLGKYKHITLQSRYGSESMPIIDVIDMRHEKMAKGSWLSLKLVNAIKNTLNNQKQVMLFLNRRGYAPITLCKSCGYKYACPNCSSYLVSHKDDDMLMCHHCGYSTKHSSACMNCNKEDSLMKCGPGVERIAEEVAKIFPNSRIQIITKDTVRNIDYAEDIIAKILDGRVDIIIGTQMISKGHDFPNISIVGVVDADLGLIGADLRSAERTYHLLTQMSGRAGRRGEGRALIQTYYPDNPILASLISNNRDQFTNYEMQNRKILNMPPFGRLSAIIISGTNEERLQEFSNLLLKFAPITHGVIVLGPVKAPLAKVRSRYRYRFLIKSMASIKVQKFISYWLELVKIPSNIRVKVDIDPYNFL
jgi:primosomal protein N' (replication factor Y)